MEEETKQVIEQFKKLWKDESVKRAITLYHKILNLPDEEYDSLVNELRATENRQNLYLIGENDE